MREQLTVINKLITTNAIHQTEIVNQFNILWTMFDHWEKIMHNFSKYWMIWMIISEEWSDLSTLNEKDLKEVVESKKEKIKKKYETR